MANTIIKVFISQPMRGLKEEDILRIREEAFKHFCVWKFKMYDFDHLPHPTIELIDNYKHPNLPEDAHPLLYLGEDIAMMAEATDVLFVDGWKQARGCQIEWEAAHLYGKDIINLEDIWPIGYQYQ